MAVIVNKKDNVLARHALIAAAGCIAALAAQAHHSYADFDAARTITLTGSVKSVEWVNPHVSFKIEVAGTGASAAEWNVETHGPAILKPYGWSSSTLKAGMQVRIVCNPKRDGSHGCRLLTVFFPEAGQTLETKLSKTLKSKALD